MAVRFELPQDIEHHLEKQWGNLPKHAPRLKRSRLMAIARGSLVVRR
jgi:hypothetical protein